MVEIFGKNYYIDIEAVTKVCQVEDKTTEENSEDTSLEINIFKYEVIKMCLATVLDELEQIDEELGAFAEKGLSPSFKIAFNTLINYQILIEEND